MSSTKKQVIGHLLTLSCGVFSSLAGTLANNTSNYKVTMLSNVMSFTLNISTYRTCMPIIQKLVCMLVKTILHSARLLLSQCTDIKTDIKTTFFFSFLIKTIKSACSRHVGY